MNRYLVKVKEVHVSVREVEAESVAEALRKAGDEEEISFYYAYSMDPSTWEVQQDNLCECSHPASDHKHLDECRAPDDCRCKLYREKS